MALQAGAPTRSHLITWLLAGMVLLVVGVPTTRAEISDLAKAAAWRLGDQLSLAGLLYAQGNQPDKVEQLLTSLKPLAGAMEAEIKPFPPRAATETETYADIIHYLIKGDGATTGQQIAEKFGMAPSTKSRSSPISCSCSTSRATTRASPG